MPIKIMKLDSAEEIIGDAHDDGQHIVVKQPCAIALIQSQSSLTNHQMGLIPYAGYAKNHTISIDPDKIIWMAEPADELYNKYNSIFGSGIQIV
ncbi:MAG: hypothetical protein EBU90_19215 [Proteobacteria bacterium]|nr:hypothetical protein [Pseudomonadota bacterium]NBP14463.1 hypothetical protein [bacterium]